MAERYANFQEMISVKRGNYGVVELEEVNEKSKGIKVKLTDAIDKEEIINLPMKSESGMTVYRSVKFVPGKLYALPKDDVAFRETLVKRGIVKRRYDEALVKKLESAGTPFEVIKCPSCGGRVRKIEYQRIEVIGDE